MGGAQSKPRVARPVPRAGSLRTSRRPLAFSAMLSSSLFFQSVYQIPAALLGSSLLPKLIS